MRNIKEYLSYEEFEILWTMKAKELGKEKNIILNAQQWLLYVQNFLEEFFLKHLNLTEEDFVNFGYRDDLIIVTKKISSITVLNSLIFIGANNNLNFKISLMENAYLFSLNLYMEHSKDNENTKSEIIKKYKDNFELYGEGIQNEISEEVLMMRLANIRDIFSFNKKELQYIKDNLDPEKELDSSIVVDLNYYYKIYINQTKYGDM